MTRVMLFAKRFFRRLKHLLRIHEMWTWEYESCNRCGCCYRLPAGWVDDIWLEVNGRENGCLCVDCFLTLAQAKGIDIRLDDIERLYVFSPKGCCFYVIEPTGRHMREEEK